MSYESFKFIEFFFIDHGYSFVSCGVLDRLEDTFELSFEEENGFV